MSEMVERVARALDPGAFEEPFKLRRDGRSNDVRAARKQARKLARVAIAAMREPTAEMSVAGLRGESRGDDSDDIWQTMNDAALATPNTGNEGR